MSSAHKEHVKSLKAPDPLQVKMMYIVDWAVKNARLLVYAVAPVIVIVAGSFGYQYFQAKRKDSRLEELGKVQVVYDAEARKAGEARQAIQKQIEAIDAKVAKASTAKDGKEAAKAADDPATKAEKEKLQKQAEAIRPDHAESAGKFFDYFKKHEAYPEGWFAGMTAARIYMDEEKYADARGILDSVVAKSKDHIIYQTQSRLALIGLLEEQGEYDKALAETDALEKVVDPELKPKVLLARGRLQMLKNSKADAKATFNSLIDTYGTSQEAQKARSMIALLN